MQYFHVYYKLKDPHLDQHLRSLRYPIEVNADPDEPIYVHIGFIRGRDGEDALRKVNADQCESVIDRRTTSTIGPQGMKRAWTVAAFMREPSMARGESLLEAESSARNDDIILIPVTLAANLVDCYSKPLCNPMILPVDPNALTRLYDILLESRLSEIMQDVDVHVRIRKSPASSSPMRNILVDNFLSWASRHPERRKGPFMYRGKPYPQWLRMFTDYGEVLSTLAAPRS